MSDADFPVPAPTPEEAENIMRAFMATPFMSQMMDLDVQSRDNLGDEIAGKVAARLLEPMVSAEIPEYVAEGVKKGAQYGAMEYHFVAPTNAGDGFIVQITLYPSGKIRLQLLTMNNAIFWQATLEHISR